MHAEESGTVGGYAQPKTPPLPQTLDKAVAMASPRWLAICVLTTSRGCPGGAVRVRSESGGGGRAGFTESAALGKGRESVGFRSKKAETARAHLEDVHDRSDCDVGPATGRER